MYRVEEHHLTPYIREGDLEDTLKKKLYLKNKYLKKYYIL